MKRKKPVPNMEDMDELDGGDTENFGDFPMPPVSHDPFLTERFNRIVGRYFEQNTPRTIEEANRVMQSRFMGHNLDELLEETRKKGWSDADEAQEIMFEAMSTDSFEEAQKGVKKALQLDPNNADALLFASIKEAEDVDDAVRRIREAIARVETAFGAEFMEETKGHFWGDVFTRPYMRLRLGLFHILNEAERWDEAIAEAEGILELNPDDNQGVRDHLLLAYLVVGNTKQARALMKRYPESHKAVQAWATVFEKYISNNKEGAKKALLKAVKNNPHILKYMLGVEALPDSPPPYYSPGTESEAIYCMDFLIPVLLKRKNLLHWINETLVRHGIFV
ncbi:MAG TPA: hypothetical protein PK967_14900 [Candidatus Hydrogenedentes bacterium]|nr:hypothetical protein [Candidatus Hydrogenedentota bacterium]